MSVAKRVTFRGRLLWLLADERFDESEMVLAWPDQCGKFGEILLASADPKDSFGAVVGNDVWSEGRIVGSRHDIVEVRAP